MLAFSGGGVGSWLDDKLGADVVWGGEGAEECALSVRTGYGAWLGLVLPFGSRGERDEGGGDGV